MNAMRCALALAAAAAFVTNPQRAVRRLQAGDSLDDVRFAGTRRLSDDITEEKGAVNRRVEVHMMPYAPPGRL